MAYKKIEKLSDLTPDKKNPNRGTERGRDLLERSVRKYGIARSIVVDRDGNIKAGNTTVDVVGALTSGEAEIQVVQSDGKKLIVVQRTDWDENSKEAREYRHVDNRTSEVGFELDAEILREELEASTVDLSEFYTKKELEFKLSESPIVDEPEGASAGGSGSDELFLSSKGLKIPVTEDEVSALKEEFKKYQKLAGGPDSSGFITSILSHVD